MKYKDILIGVISILVGIIVLNLNSNYGPICFVFFVAFGLLYIMYASYEEDKSNLTDTKIKITKDYKLPNVSLLGKKSVIDDNLLEYKVKLLLALEEFKLKGEVSEVYAGSKTLRFVVDFVNAKNITKLLNNKDAFAYFFGLGPIEVKGLDKNDSVEIICKNPEPYTYPLRNAVTAGNKNLLFYVGHLDNGENYTIDLEKCGSIGITGNNNEEIDNFFNVLIVSLLMKRTPNELEFALIDNGGLDFTYFNNIPHLMYPVATKEDTTLIDKIYAEVQNRVESLQNMSLNEYNKKTENPLKKIVLFINDLDYTIYKETDKYDKLKKIIETGKDLGIYTVFSVNFLESTNNILGLCDTLVAFSHPKKTKFNKFEDTDIEGCFYVNDGTLSTRVYPSYVDDGTIVKVAGFWINQNDELAK